MSEDDSLLMRRIVESHAYLLELVGDKNTSIDRLRKLIFGSRSEKTKDVVDDVQDDASPADATPRDGAVDQDSEANAESEVESEVDSSTPRPGHGRLGADDYPGAEQVDVPHASLAVGDNCPDCGQGTLYDKKPSVLVRFVGQAPLQAKVYRLQKLRCHLCGKVFTARLPRMRGTQKYDHSVASMIGLLKYGSGFPFNRLQRLQGSCDIPLAASTQWDIIHAAAKLIAPAYEELIRQAAQGEVVYNDDTTVKILELMGARAKKTPPPTTNTIRNAPVYLLRA